MKYFLSLLFIVFLLSCSQEKQDTDKPAKDQSDMEMPNDHPDVNQPPQKQVKIEDDKIFLADFSMKIPEGWSNEQPQSSMRLTKFVPERDKELEIIGFYFGNQPNMVEGNINRWKGQFTEVTDFNEEKVANDNVIYVRINGTFKKKPFPMAQEYKEVSDYMMLASIIPSPEGPYFFKVTGPKESLEQEIEKFKEFMDSYRKEAGDQKS